jgi:hypothetical protein
VWLNVGGFDNFKDDFELVPIFRTDHDTSNGKKILFRQKIVNKEAALLFMNNVFIVSQENNIYSFLQF